MVLLSPDGDTQGLAWPALIAGTLVRRYKRFLADVRLENGETVSVHCPNSGRMDACCEPGRQVYVSIHDTPRRKLKYTWELIEMPTSLVGVNTQVPNRLVYEAIRAGLIDGLKGYDVIHREVAVGDRTRLDIGLRRGTKESCFVEIKNCTLVQEGLAAFPDAVTARGLKHLKTLQKLVSAGARGVIFFLIQRMDARIFQPADHIDPVYGIQLRRSVAAGVEIMVYDVHIDLKRIQIRRKVPCRL